MNSSIKTILIWTVIFLSVVIIGNYIMNYNKSVNITYSDFIEQFEKGNIKSVVIKNTNVNGKFKVPFEEKKVKYMEFKTKLPYPDTDLIHKLTAKGVQIKAKSNDVYWDIIVGWVPWLLILGLFWFFLMGRMNSGAKDALKFGQSGVKISKEKRLNISFKDVAGCDEAKEELKEVIDFLKSPAKYKLIGARIPKGVLLVGLPGTGKTLLAKAVAGEAEVPFLSISGSEFVELFVGVGAARVRDLFTQAKVNAPCIIFIDEIDAVGRLRGAGLGGGHDEREQTLNQMLVEMDGFDTSEGIVVMAATNRPDILDPALLRPGRFDRQIVVPVPDVRGREAILKIHAKNVPLDESVDLSVIAKQTPGFTGADLENLVNEAALLAARENKEKVGMNHFEEAKDKVIMGVARKSLVMSEDERKKIAYHESGHAIVTRLLPGTDPVHKITIIPRGRALGVTQSLPVKDRHLYSKNYLLNTIAIMLGGRAAERIIFNEETTGAADDLERATKLTRKMVCEWGMSERIGPVTFGKTEEEIFLGREMGVRRYYSEETAKEIDDEIKRIIRESETKAENILKNHKKELDETANLLLEKETITGDELDKILGITEQKEQEENEPKKAD